MVTDRQTDISIIIPVYNSEKYIEECLYSCKDQSFKNFEIIVIDDCSNDRSSKIVSGFFESSQMKYKIIQLNKNCGVSYCRNIGVKNAEGKYVYFLDSDDVLAKDALEVLYSTAEKFFSPVVFGKYCRFSLENPRRECLEFDDYNVEKIIISYKELQARIYAGTIWGGIILKSIIIDNGIRFDESLKYGEDTLFKIALLEHVDYILEVDKILYYWRIVSGSLSDSTCFEKTLERESALLEKVVYLLKTVKKSSAYSRLLLRYFRMKKNAIYRMCLDKQVKGNIIIDKMHLNIGTVLKSINNINCRNTIEIIYAIFPCLDTWKVQRNLFMLIYGKK